MNYVLGDLHGEKSKFAKMLDVIHFSSSDMLYILGDVLDRGKEGIPLLVKIMQMNNVKLLLGNHEYMARNVFNKGKQADIDLWLRNHSKYTIRDFLDLSREKQNQIIDFLNSLPSYMDVTVGSKNFYLVHGFPGDTVRQRVWSRPDSIYTQSPIRDHTVIIGHTPVVLLECSGFEQDIYFKNLRKSNGHMQILHSQCGWIDVDCGCGYQNVPSALACLRLDDMKEFYIC